MSDISLENKTTANLNVPGFSLILPPLVTESLVWDLDSQLALEQGGDDLQSVIDALDLEVTIPDSLGNPLVVTNVALQSTLSLSRVKLQYFLDQKIPKNSVRFAKNLGHKEPHTSVPIVLERNHNIIGISMVTEQSDSNQDYIVALYKGVRWTPIWVADLLSYPSGSEYSTWDFMEVLMSTGEEYGIGIRQSTSVTQASKFKQTSIILSLEVA